MIPFSSQKNKLWFDLCFYWIDNHLYKHATVSVRAVTSSQLVLAIRLMFKCEYVDNMQS